MKNKPRVYIGSDHAAYPEKEFLRDAFKDKFDLIDLGTHSIESTHYPIYAQQLAKSVLEDQAFGILLCGSGIGMSIAANRYKGIRAALCRNEYDAEMSRKHNDANVLCLGARTTSKEVLKKLVEVFFSSEFEGGRH